MPKMTDEEADALDEYYTKNPPTPGPNGTGFFTRRRKALSEAVLRTAQPPGVIGRGADFNF